MKEVVASSLKVERLQTRANTDSGYIDEIAERMGAGDSFPPIVVFTDGKDSWLSDGIHRLDGAIKAKKKIAVDYRKGTRADAVEYACGANASHGMRRTNADKRRAVTLALSQFPDRSNRAIAELCGVGDGIVSEVRDSRTCIKKTEKTRVGRDGKRQPARKPPTKISGGTSFDVAEIESSKPPKSGEQLRDPRAFDRWEDAFGKLKRATDDLHRACPNKERASRIHDNLNAAYDVKEQWANEPA